MILVDTSAWYALYTPRDEDHTRANEWRKANRERLVTTEHVVVETLNLLTVRKEPERARELSRSLFGEIAAKLYHATDADILRAREVFERFADKEWSFTDCVSYAVIQRLRIKKAFAFDDHFRQFGIVEVVP